jgi:hypothetical protein
MTVCCASLDKIYTNLHTRRSLYQYDIWCMSLCIDDCLVYRCKLQTKWSSIQSDMYQMSYWYNLFSWWWAHGCPKHVEKRNKHTWKRNVRQVDYVQRLYRDARSTEHKIQLVEITLQFFFLYIVLLIVIYYLWSAQKCV